MGQPQMDAKQVVMAQIHRQHPGPLLPGRQRQAGDEGAGAHAATDPLQGNAIHSGPLISSSASRGKRSRKATSRSLKAMS